MQVAALHAVARMTADVDLDQRVARLSRSLLALTLEPDGLAVLDIGGQLDRDLAAVGEHRRHLFGGGCLLDADIQRDVQIRGLHRLTAIAAPAAATRAGEGVAKN